MSRHGPDPARLAYNAMVSTARQLAQEQGSITEAIIAIRAGFDGRNDLLAQACGTGVGLWSVQPTYPTDLLAAGLLAASIYQIDALALRPWIEIGRDRGTLGGRYRA